MGGHCSKMQEEPAKKENLSSSTPVPPLSRETSVSLEYDTATEQVPNPLVAPMLTGSSMGEMPVDDRQFISITESDSEAVDEDEDTDRDTLLTRVQQPQRIVRIKKTTQQQLQDGFSGLEARDTTSHTGNHCTAIMMAERMGNGWVLSLSNFKGNARWLLGENYNPDIRVFVDTLIPDSLKTPHRQWVTTTFNSTRSSYWDNFFNGMLKRRALDLKAPTTSVEQLGMDIRQSVQIQMQLLDRSSAGLKATKLGETVGPFAVEFSQVTPPAVYNYSPVFFPAPKREGVSFAGLSPSAPPPRPRVKMIGPSA